MLKWKEPELSDIEWIKEAVVKSGEMGSDISFVNMYLLRKKYDIEICRYKDFVVRYYNGVGARKGYTFPVGDYRAEDDIKKLLFELKEDARLRNCDMQFAFLTETQKELLEKFIPKDFIYENDLGDSDYVYLASDLANLSGKAFHKKKNHVSRFTRTYSDYQYSEIGCNNRDDAALVADMWYYEHLQSESDSQLKEYMAIKEALNYFDRLELKGGVIYVNETPVAMTIASVINNETADIHFEKVIGEYAAFGGYAAINNIFAKQLYKSGIKWINREEDIGIEGLRKAKMSYRPKLMIKKYGAVKK